MNLAMLYLKGEGVPKDFAKAASLLEQAFDSDVGVLAKVKLACMYLGSFGQCPSGSFSQSFDLEMKATRLLREAVEAGSDLAQTILMGNAEGLKDMERFLAKTADADAFLNFAHWSQKEKQLYANRAETANALGMYYICGCRVPENIQKGIPFLKRAVEEDSARAMYNLGKLLLAGTSEVDKNVEWGTELMKKAAEAGLVDARQWLGDSGVTSTGPAIPQANLNAATLILPCGNCGKPHPSKRCSRCKKAWYCSAHCQGVAWKAGHRLLCFPPSSIARQNISNIVDKPMQHSEVPDTDKEAQRESLGTAESVNAAVSEALPLSNPVAEQGERSIVVLEYTRCPEVVWRVLAESPMLSDMRGRLTSAGYSWNTPCGAKIFVNPEDVKVVLEEIRHQGWELKPWHAVVTAEKEELVCAVLDKAIKDIPKSKRGSCKVRRRNTLTVNDRVYRA